MKNLNKKEYAVRGTQYVVQGINKFSSLNQAPRTTYYGLKLMGLTMMLIFMASFSFGARSIQTPEEKLLSKAFEAYMDGRDKTALELFDEVMRLNPNNKAAHEGLKKVKSRINKQDKQELNKMKLLAESKYKEGQKFLDSNDYVGAVDSFQEALVATPNYRPASKELRRIKRKVKRKLDKKKFSPTEWAYYRGVLAYMEKDWSKAYRIWSQRLTIEPSNVVLANSKARAENRFKTIMMDEREDFFRQSARTLYEQGYYERAKLSWANVLDATPDDQEALEGIARSEKELIRIAGKGSHQQFDELFEKALNLYANQEWKKSKKSFVELTQLDPEFKAAQEYITRINRNLQDSQYNPALNVASTTRDPWKEQKPSNTGLESVVVPEGTENLAERRAQLESQLKRDPSNIKVQQELDKVVKQQAEEGERIYKDGLIVYSQGNRPMAITKWKQVLIMFPEHKKAAAALRKARAEEERSASREE